MNSFVHNLKRMGNRVVGEQDFASFNSLRPSDAYVRQ